MPRHILFGVGGFVVGILLSIILVIISMVRPATTDRWFEGIETGKRIQLMADLRLVCDRETEVYERYLVYVNRDDRSESRQYAIERHMEAGAIRTMLRHQRPGMGTETAMKGPIQPGCPGWQE